MKLSVNSTLIALFLGALIFFAWGCRSREQSDVISAGKGFTVTADSVVVDGRIYREVDLATDSLVEMPETYPRFTSSSTLLNALYAQGMSDASNFASGDTTFRATADPIEKAIVTQLLLSLLDAEKGMALLKSEWRESLWNYPLTASGTAWLPAAREIFRVSGSDEWLSETLAQAKKLLKQYCAVSYDRRLGLICGGVDGNESPTYPEWFLTSDVVSSVSLLNNVFFFSGIATCREMAEAKGEETAKWDFLPPWDDETRHRLNRAFWVPERNAYAEILYAEPFYIQSAVSSTRASALAVIDGIATGEQSNVLIEKTPMTERGVTQKVPSDKRGTDVTDALTNALWGIVAANWKNEEALKTVTGGLLLKALENDGMAGLAGGMTILRGICGITLTENEMTFAPMIPEFLKDSVKVENLRYRDKEIELVIFGQGSEIAEFAVDGIAQDNNLVGVNKDLGAGHHRVEIRMARASGDDSKVSIASGPGVIPPTPEIVRPEKMTIGIVNFNENSTYELFQNGVLDVGWKKPTVSIPRSHKFSEFCLVPVDDDLKGFSSRPIFIYPKDVLTTLQAEDVSKPGTKLIKDKRAAERLVHSDRRHNRTIKFRLDEEEETGAFLQLCYSNGNGSITDGNAAAIRSVWVNGEFCGSFIMPARGEGWWLSTHNSNMVGCLLRKGENTLEIRTEATAIGNLPILADYLRIIRVDKRYF